MATLPLFTYYNNLTIKIHTFLFKSRDIVYVENSLLIMEKIFISFPAKVCYITILVRRQA